MRSFNLLFIFIACLYSTFAVANNVAVIDTRAAVLNSKAAKKALAKLENDVASDRERLTQIQQEMSSLESRFKSKRDSMKDSEKESMQHQAQAKLKEYNELGQRVQQRIEQSQSQLLTQLMPKLTAGVTEIRRHKKIDIVIDKKYVYAVADAWDITSQVTQYIDSQK